MKKLQLVFVFLISLTAFSQAPQSMSYQAVVRDAGDNLIINQTVGIQISIIEVGVGTIAYVETQTPMTNANGLVSLKIGEGNVQSGVFAVINWAGANYEIKTEVDVTGGTNYTVSGTSQLLSVPYAFYAKTAGGDTSVIKDADGNTQIQTEESPNEDIIRFDLAGTAKWVMKDNALEQLNSGESLFIGQDAGANDDLLANKNVFLGFGSGFSNTSGDENVAVGHNTLVSNTTGTNNTALGFNALFSNDDGGFNTALGSEALFTNTIGSKNTAVGNLTLRDNEDGAENTAVGDLALFNNTSGSRNTAIGTSTLIGNTIGGNNVAVGYSVLNSNSEGDENIAIGSIVMNDNTAGGFNIALGNGALHRNIDGDLNIAIGSSPLVSNLNGSENISFGRLSLTNNETGNRNIALGYLSMNGNESGSNNIAIGSNTNFTGTNFFNSTAIGYQTSISGSNQIHLGNSSITEIKGQVNFTTYSDGRVKDNIKEDVQGLDFILKLRPVTYNFNIDKQNRLMGIEDNSKYATKNDLEKMKMSGFIAQEVEKSAQEINYDFSGVHAPKNDKELYGLSYAEFVVPLVKAIQEQQEEIEMLKVKVAKVDDLQNQIDALKQLIMEKN